MNKANVRAFSLGMLFVTFLLALLLPFFPENDSEAKRTNEQALQEAEEKISHLQKTIAQLEKEKQQLEKQINPQDAEHKEEKQDPVPLEIVAGMTNDDVAELLRRKNLIDSEQEFKQFMITEGYDRKIQIGIHILYPNMSYDSIARTITNSQ